MPVTRSKGWVTKEDDLYRIDCGDVGFVRRFRDTQDYNKGYFYNFEVGDDWIIPLHLHVDLKGNDADQNLASRPDAMLKEHRDGRS